MLFIEKLWRNPAYFLTWITVITFSICVHELSHVYAAASQGDDTAMRRGYATLDPRQLMGRTSLICLVLFGIAWGAVPVDTSRLRRPWSHALVSAAGPGSNLLLAVFGALGLVLTERFAPELQPAILLFYCLLAGNCLLALLNLMPIPMFDGWQIYAFFIPPLKTISNERKNMLTWILFIVMFFSPGGGFLFSASRRMADIMHETIKWCIV